MNEELQVLLFKDPVRFARVVLPDWFPSKMPWVHRAIIALVLQRTDFLLNFGREVWRDGEAEWTLEDLETLVENFTYSPEPDDPVSPVIHLFEIERNSAGAPVAVHLVTSRFLEVMLPRGLSKTTLFNFLILFMIAYKLSDYVMYISEAQTHAERQLGNVKRVMEQNELYRELYGNLVPERNDPRKWTEDFIETMSGIAVMARGRGGQIRGANVNARRPDIILLDDVEDADSVKTPEQRNKTMSWLMGDVRPALPRHKGRIFVLCTMLHAESMAARLQSQPDWVTVRFGAMLPNGKPLARYYMDEKQWMRERQSFQRLGQLAQFYMEYQSTIHMDSENRKFRPEEWRVQVMSRVEFEAVAEAIDPAISEKVGSDSCVIAVSGMTSKGQIHVLDLWSKVGAQPREQVDEFFRLHFAWNVTLHGVESVAYQKALIFLLQEEMHRKSLQHGNSAYFAIKPITHGKTAKVERVEGILSPRYAAGYITHQRHFQKLHEEAIDWPSGKKDHLDAVAMSVGLLSPMSAFAAPTIEESIRASDWAEIQEASLVCP